MIPTPYHLEAFMVEILKLNEEIRGGLREDYPEEIKQRLQAFLRDGPASVDAWASSIETYESYADLLDAKIAALRKRKQAFRDRANKMRKELSSVLTNAFNGRIMTGERTMFVRGDNQLVIR
jgi:hypothetical protein